MIRNYLTVAIRNLLRQKAYSLINVLGLAIGIACCILILQYVRHELAYDWHSSLAERTYRVLRETRRTDGSSSFDEGLSGPLSLAMEEEIPEVERVARRWGHGGVTFRRGDTRLQGGIVVVDPAFFEIFDLALDGGGDPERVLRQPGTILVRKDRMQKYFGDEDPVGQTISVHDAIARGTYVVAGILEGVPPNTTVHYDDFITTHHPNEAYPKELWFRWLPGTWRMTSIYVVLQEEASVREVERKLATIMERHLGPEVARVDRYRLQKLTRTRLYSAADFGITSERRIDDLYALITTAALVILVACVNFVNLSTARAARRSREIGIRKATGARRGQLIRQFLGEALLTSGLAGVLALLGSWLMLPAFSSFLGTKLTLEADILLWTIGLALLVGGLAGIYPALFLSGFEPASSLKGSEAAAGRGWLRRTLVVLQFAISILLIIGTLTIYAQLGYIQDRDLGYDDEGIIALPFFSRGVSRREQERVREAFASHPDVLSVSLASGRNFTNPTRVSVKRLDREEELSIHQIQADRGFLDIFRISLLDGRNFREQTLKDLGRNGPDEFIINQTAARALGFGPEESPVGSLVQVYGGDQKRLYRKDRLEGTIVGVVPDFHFQSLHEPIKPLMINPHYWVWHVLLRVRAGRMSETLAFCEQTWYRFAPDIVFRFAFQDERTENAYQAERQTATLSVLAAALAIVVGCLGLVGLAAFAAEQRSKEVGIRKVLGASVLSVLRLLSAEFGRLVLIANLIAWPVAYFVSRAWLGSFAYRVQMGVEVFLAGGAIVAALALVTVLWQTLKAATADPADVLRTE